VPRSTRISRGMIRALIFCASAVAALVGVLCGPTAIGKPLPGQAAAQTKIAEGEYAIQERESSGAVGPFQEEVYNFRESWTLWRTGQGEYEVEGVQSFESPNDLIPTASSPNLPATSR
jgi:hypothetical protein